MAKKKRIEDTQTCLCCGEEKNITDFYKSNSPMFKLNGRLPICKQCMLEVYEENFQFYKDEEKALYKTLFSLDIYFDLKTSKRAIVDTYGTDKSILKYYMSQIGLKGGNLTAKNSPFKNIFDVVEEKEIDFELENLVMEDEPFLITKEMIYKWGEGRDVKDYMFLENEYKTMCSTYGDKNPYSLSSYEQIALNRLLLKKEWGKDRPDSRTIKDFNSLISSLASDCKMKEAQVGNTEDDNARFSKFIERIEFNEPILSDARFDDYDNIHNVWREDFRQPFAQAMELDKKPIKGDIDDTNEN